MRQIITSTGEILPLSVWQERKGYKEYELGKFFSTREKKLVDDTWTLHELLFVILDELRILAKKPIIINSAYRTTAEQLALQGKNKGAVTHSPHTYGLAIDIDTVSDAETLRYVAHLRKIAKDLNLQIRIGWNQYQNMKPKQTFVHIDVAPEMFGAGKVWGFFPNTPEAFKKATEW